LHGVLANHIQPNQTPGEPMDDTGGAPSTLAASQMVVAWVEDQPSRLWSLGCHSNRTISVIVPVAVYHLIAANDFPDEAVH